ncbi:MAG: helix-turn-helix domain-containing protein, partial [Finegoldia magna]
NLFKEKYGQSITEYTQRKRMNVAETLLLNTELPIKEIAESVGYSSASKFSIYYKRYKGKLPSEVRNLACKHRNLKCDYCD